MQYKSKEQPQALALKIVFKIAEHKASQADILRMPSNLLNDLEKIVYLNLTEHDVNDTLESFNEGCFYARMINNHKEFHHQKLISQLAIATKLAHHLRRYRCILKLLKKLMLWRLLLLEDANLLDLINKNILPKESKKISDKLQELIHERHAVLKQMQQRQWIILNSRHTQIKRLIQAIREQREIPLLAGMTYANQIKFIKSYFLLKEKAATESTLLKEKMAWVTLQQVKVLGDNTSNLQVNTHISDEQCMTKLQDFENDERVRGALEEHLAVVIEQTQLLEEDKQALAEIEEELSRVLGAANQEEFALSDTEKTLLESIETTELASILTELNFDSQVVPQWRKKPTHSLQKT